MNALNRYLAGVLTVIALGISVIAYNLAFPHSQSLLTLDPGAVPLTGAALKAATGAAGAG